MKSRRPHVRGAMLLLASLAFLLGCAQKAPQEGTRIPMTERQRDSTIAASKLPGASAVGRALEIADSAAVRASRPLRESR